MELSVRMSLIKPSSTISLTDKANKLRMEGKNICVLSIGQPDFDTPNHIKKAGIQAIFDGKTKYTAMDGTAELKDAIIAKLRRDNQLEYKRDQICVGAGAKQVLFNLFMATISAGDEVIVPAPYYDNYVDMVNIFGGVSVVIQCEKDFKLTPEQLKGKITRHTKWLILNSPNNPSGAVYSRDDLKGLAAVLLEYPHVNIISDDIYEFITYDETFCTIAQVEPKLYDRVFVVNGVSKAYAMTGWRIGYVVGDVKVIAAVTMLQSLCTSNPNSIAQEAAVEALNGDHSFMAERTATYRHRRDFVVSELGSMNGLSVARPQGAFYLFVSCKGVINKRTKNGKLIANDVDFAEYLLEDYLVCVVPGCSFGMANHIRICYAYSREQLEVGCKRISAACQALVD
ncbi:probable aspartate/prephenate aminotransferase [Bradysia coprophila]|uniref:probable aspartate/prephenate aminotransferase n=1 Tax=Bradysia coprophila TaxID=38358 RepID=UPI00187D86FA|nr:probable aspartate/prephenate aminotransferase [Bradysia coprophila]